MPSSEIHRAAKRIGLEPAEAQADELDRTDEELDTLRHLAGVAEQIFEHQGPLTQDLRDLVIKAIASNADPCNAREVLAYALGQLRSEVQVLICARETVDHMSLEQALYGVRYRIEALQDFAQRHLDVNFTTSREPEASES